MASLTPRDRKTIRFAALGIAIYLGLFFGVKLWRHLERDRAGYDLLLTQARREVQAARDDENRALLFEKLSAQFRLDPRKISRETLVAQASAAIQDAARQSGIQLGPVRETAGRATARELSTIQFDGLGQVTAALGLVHKIQSLGFPLVIDSVQLTPQMNPPGMLKLNLTVIILNFEQWKTAGGKNA